MAIKAMPETWKTEEFLLNIYNHSKVRHNVNVSQVAHQARAYSGFCSMKRLGVLLLSLSPLQGYPQH